MRKRYGSPLNFKYILAFQNISLTSCIFKFPMKWKVNSFLSKCVCLSHFVLQIYVFCKLPPFFVLHTGGDPGVPQGADSGWRSGFPVLFFTLHQQLISAAAGDPWQRLIHLCLGQLLRVASVSLRCWKEDRLYLQLLQRSSGFLTAVQEGRDPTAPCFKICHPGDLIRAAVQFFPIALSPAGPMIYRACQEIQSVNSYRKCARFITIPLKNNGFAYKDFWRVQSGEGESASKSTCLV